MNLYLHIYVAIENVLTPNMLLFPSLQKWKKTLDNVYTGEVVMDLSKAFDTTNNEMLIAKLHAHRFSKDALKFIFSYTSDRWHRSKVNKWSSFLSALTFFSRETNLNI